MTEQTLEKAIRIRKEINWIEHGEYKDYPKNVDCDKAAKLVVEGLYTLYKKEINKFCTDLVSRYFSEREQRLKELREEFEAL